MINTSRADLERNDLRNREPEGTLPPMIIGDLALALVGMTVIVFFV